MHLSLPVDADGRTTLAVSLVIGAPQVRFQAHGASSFGDFGPWTCTDTTPSAQLETTQITCSLEIVGPGTPTTLGIDLAYPGEPLLTATVDAPGGVDPDPSNNTVQLRLGPLATDGGPSPDGVTSATG